MAAIKRGTPTPTEIVMIASSEREWHHLRFGKKKPTKPIKINKLINLLKTKQCL